MQTHTQTHNVKMVKDVNWNFTSEVKQMANNNIINY